MLCSFWDEIACVQWQLIQRIDVESTMVPETKEDSFHEKHFSSILAIKFWTATDLKWWYVERSHSDSSYIATQEKVVYTDETYWNVGQCVSHSQLPNIFVFQGTLQKGKGKKLYKAIRNSGIQRLWENDHVAADVQGHQTNEYQPVRPANQNESRSHVNGVQPRNKNQFQLSFLQFMIGYTIFSHWTWNTCGHYIFYFKW